MAVVPARLVAATREQMAARAGMLERGATHVGWKLGMGDREAIDGHLAVGFLTSATVLDPGSSFDAPPGADLHLDVEAYVELAADHPDAIGGYGVALEIVDLTPRPGEPDSIVATNIFHLAVSFAPTAAAEPRGAELGVLVNGTLGQAGRWPHDLGDRLRGAADVLEAVGLGLRAGDRIITGSIVQVPIAPGESVAAVIGEDELLTLQIA